MHYTYYGYFTWAVGIPLAMIGLLLVCCIVCTFIFHRRKLNIFLQVLPIITFLLTCMILILIMYPALPFLEELPSEKDEMPLTDVVLVEQLQSVSPLPIYYSTSQKTFLGSEILHTDRGSFYCIGSNRIQPGSYVQFTFLPYSRAVLQWNILLAEEAIAYQNAHPELPAAPVRESQEAGIPPELGLAIFSPLLIYIGISTIWGDKVAGQLLSKDRYNQKKIKLRPYGIAKFICTILYALFLILFFSILKKWVLSTACTFALGGYIWIKSRVYSAKLSYTKRHLIFITGQKQEVFPWSEVSQVSWASYPREVAFTLEIRFYSGLVARLPSTDFVGLTKLKSFYDQNYSGK